jgi:uncharacterized protein (DUF952 family)
MFPPMECVRISWRVRGKLSKNITTLRCVNLVRLPKAQAPRSPLTTAAQGGITAPMLIFKIFRTDEWQTLRKQGETAGAPIDLADGYIHFSTATQAAETAAKHFTGAEGLFLVAAEAKTLGDELKWEVSRGDALFPHLYRKLTMADVTWAQPLPLVDGAHQFPAGLEEAAL